MWPMVHIRPLTVFILVYIFSFTNIIGTIFLVTVESRSAMGFRRHDEKDSTGELHTALQKNKK